MRIKSRPGSTPNYTLLTAFSRPLYMYLFRRSCAFPLRRSTISQISQ